jgi:DNA-binding transcriptional MerR regulator
MFDKEWIQLMEIAKESGVSKEEVRTFIEENEHLINVPDFDEMSNVSAIQWYTSEVRRVTALPIHERKAQIKELLRVKKKLNEKLTKRG